MSQSETLERFIASSFQSVWSLELLLLMKREERPWSKQELVTTMRASDLVVTKAIDGLAAAGLAVVEDEQVSYLPVSPGVAALVSEVESFYAARPDAVRRIIIAASTSGAAAFANAFKLRKD